MRAWTLGILMAVGLAMPVAAAAKPKLPEAVAPLPDIQEMLTHTGYRPYLHNAKQWTALCRN